VTAVSGRHTEPRVHRGDRAWVHRGALALRPDPSRVLGRLFLPGQELLSSGKSRADAVIARVLSLDEDQAARVLADTIAGFAHRHHDLVGMFREHFDLYAHRIEGVSDLSATRRDLLGAYFTQEYALEAAALFNPSLVAHPNQSGLVDGELRFVMSLRAVGEGHISSIEFRTGVLGSSGLDAPDGARRAREVRLDAPDPHPDTGVVTPGSMSSNRRAAPFPAAIPAPPDATYRLRFDAERPLSARVVFPTVPVEANGIEDARFVRFTEDGGVTYHATYTAFDGSNIAPRLLTTEDFVTFESRHQIGPSARDKGMALFPRRVGGDYLALTRWDRETLGLTRSDDAITWAASTTLIRPEQPWDLVQLGQCGSPLETEAGWLVLTHGVGPMRTYGLGAILLDLEDPSRVLGSLDRPLLSPTEQERDGYVPNVVYSCGGLLHDGQLVLPYGCSDAEVRFAFVDLELLLDELLQQTER
jgi:predicted GH43/DUF377 family glycosyl hydrolase